LRPDLLRSVSLIAGGAVTGAVGWIGHPLAFGIAVAFPALWAGSPTRLIAASVAAAHFLAASRGLPIGTANFFGTGMTGGIALWFAAAASFVAVHAFLWTGKPGWQRPIRYAIVAILMGVPPFGIVGWAHPITAAGALFPGWDWVGLLATFLLLIAMTTRAMPVVAGIAMAAFAWSAVTNEPARQLSGWVGLDTEFGGSGGQAQFAGMSIQLETIARVREAAGKGTSVVLLPESAAGLWTPTVERLWQAELRGLGVTALVGAVIVDAKGYDNVIVAVSAERSEIIYRERMPVPVSMWRPWNAWAGGAGGARAHFLGNPVAVIDGLRIAPLICYEQLIIWPILQAMLHRPDVIVATGNGWWTGGTNIIAIQRASAEAWARLFDVPLMLAFNR
jgi:hypothetical protein